MDYQLSTFTKINGIPLLPPLVSKFIFAMEYNIFDCFNLKLYYR